MLLSFCRVIHDVFVSANSNHVYSIAMFYCKNKVHSSMQIYSKCNQNVINNLILSRAHELCSKLKLSRCLSVLEFWVVWLYALCWGKWVLGTVFQRENKRRENPRNNSSVATNGRNLIWWARLTFDGCRGILGMVSTFYCFLPKSLPTTTNLHFSN